MVNPPKKFQVEQKTIKRIKELPFVSVLVRTMARFFQKEKRVIAIPIKDNQGLDSELNPILAHANFFLIINTDHKEIKDFYSINNPYAQEETGAGLKTAHYLAKKGIDVLITLEIGSIALHALRSKGIDVYINQAKTAKEVIEELFSQESKRTQGAKEKS